MGMVLGLLCGGQYAAAENIDYQSLYYEGVQDGYIDSNQLSLEQWIVENEEFEKVFKDGKNESVLENSLSYSDWLKSNNFGQFPEEIAIESRGWANGTSSVGIVSPYGLIDHFTLSYKPVLVKTY